MCNTSRFAPANDCLLFVLVKLAFLALISGTVWLDSFIPIFIFRKVNTVLLVQMLALKEVNKIQFCSKWGTEYTELRLKQKQTLLQWST